MKLQGITIQKRHVILDKCLKFLLLGWGAFGGYRLLVREGVRENVKEKVRPCPVYRFLVIGLRFSVKGRWLVMKAAGSFEYPAKLSQMF